jgi:naringenin degradation protein FdeJ
MASAEQHTVLVTGAGGFVGSRLVARMLAHPDFAQSTFTLVDVSVPHPPDDPRVRVVEGDLQDPAVVDALLEDAPTVVFHLAGILGGAAEADYELSRRVNIDATLALLERLRDLPTVPRVVFASSIAVFGPPLPEFVDDDVIPRPLMTYGAQKLMIETVVEQFSARGWIDGVAIRLPGIVARRDADARLKSAFLNRVFYAAEAGEELVLPVSPEGTTWLISVPACVDAFVHAALLPADRLGRRRAFTLAAQFVRIGELVEALQEVFPQSAGKIRYEKDDELQAQFAAQPPLETATADHLGFRHDGDLENLILRSMQS